MMKIKVVVLFRYGLKGQSCLTSQMSFFFFFAQFYTASGSLHFHPRHSVCHQEEKTAACWSRCWSCHGTRFWDQKRVLTACHAKRHMSCVVSPLRPRLDSAWSTRRGFRFKIRRRSPFTPPETLDVRCNRMRLQVMSKELALWSSRRCCLVMLEVERVTIRPEVASSGIVLVCLCCIVWEQKRLTHVTPLLVSKPAMVGAGRAGIV